MLLTLIELRLALISYQDYHMLLPTLAGTAFVMWASYAWRRARLRGVHAEAQAQLEWQTASTALHRWQSAYTARVTAWVSFPPCRGGTQVLTRTYQKTRPSQHGRGDSFSWGEGNPL